MPVAVPYTQGYNRKNGKHAVLQRRQQVATLYLQGATQHQIANELGVHQATISNDLKAIRKEWRLATEEDFKDKLGKELARLDRLEAMAWEAFECSRQPLSADRRDGRERPGDPRFLAQVFRCVELRLRAMGALAPDVQVNLNTVQIDWDKLLSGRRATVGTAALGDAGTVDAIEDRIGQLSLPALPAPDDRGPKEVRATVIDRRETPAALPKTVEVRRAAETRDEG